MQKTVGFSMGLIALYSMSESALGFHDLQRRTGPQIQPCVLAMIEPVTPVWELIQSTPDPRSPKSSPQDAAPSQEFQPTTQLSGEVVFALIYPTGEAQSSTRPSLGNRVRLNVATSFDGEDRLRLRLQTVNVPRLDEVFDTDLARLAIQGEEDGEFDLSRLDYRFQLGDRTTVTVPIVGGSISDIADALNPLFDSSGQGSLSRFGQRNPIFRQGGGAGIGINHELNDQINLSLGYLSDADNLLPEEDSVAFTQLAIAPTDTMRFGILYSYAVNGLDSGTGPQMANDPFENRSNTIASHSVGLQASATLTPELTLSGWAGWTRAIATDLPDTPEADILNWAITLGYLDVLGEGNQVGLVIGQPPQVLESQPPLHVELSYKIQMRDQISVTPGLVIVTEPNSAAPPIVTGVIRSTVRF